jgi:hypothetical protein
MYINRKVERFLRQHDIPATRFGRMVAGDPRLVLDMRNGRQLRADMSERIEAFMHGYDACADRKQTARDAA